MEGWKIDISHSNLTAIEQRSYHDNNSGGFILVATASRFYFDTKNRIYFAKDFFYFDSDRSIALLTAKAVVLF